MSIGRKRKRLFTCFIICVAVVATFFSWLELRGMGFPDGHVTDLGKADKLLLRIFIMGNFVFVSWFAFVGFATRKNDNGKQLYISSGCYLVFVLLLLCLHFYLATFLNNGTGG